MKSILRNSQLLNNVKAITMKSRYGIRQIGIIILAALLLLSSVSCSKKRHVLGSFFIKGRLLKASTGAPRAYLDVYVEYVYNANNIGGSYGREKAGNGMTDSLGYFMFEGTLYGGVDYTIEPAGLAITPSLNDTIDIGVRQW
jgi:hypothetical protein